MSCQRRQVADVHFAVLVVITRVVITPDELVVIEVEPQGDARAIRRRGAAHGLCPIRNPAADCTGQLRLELQPDCARNSTRLRQAFELYKLGGEEITLL